MRTAGRWLLVGWLVAALLVLGMDGRLPAFLTGAVPGSLLVLGVGSLVRQQRAPSRYNQPALPERYRVADDLRRPLTEVVAAAEQEAITAPAAVGTGWTRRLPNSQPLPPVTIPAGPAVTSAAAGCSAAWRRPPGSSATPKAASCPPARPTWTCCSMTPLLGVPPDSSIRVEVWRA